MGQRHVRAGDDRGNRVTIPTAKSPHNFLSLVILAGRPCAFVTHSLVKAITIFLTDLCEVFYEKLLHSSFTTTTTTTFTEVDAISIHIE